MGSLDPILRLEAFDYESVRAALIASAWHDEKPEDVEGSAKQLAKDFIRRLNESKGLRDLVSLADQVEPPLFKVVLHALVLSHWNKHEIEDVIRAGKAKRRPYKRALPRTFRALAKRLEEDRTLVKKHLGVEPKLFSTLSALARRAAEGEEWLRGQSLTAPGAKQSTAGHLAASLDHCLDSIPAPERRRLIASLVTDFIEPKSAEQVRLLLLAHYERQRGRKSRA